MLEISTRKLVNNLFAGEYHTFFKGQGMTFAEFREYVAGDDVRAISWPVTARAGKPFIKKFDEERELTVMLAVDISGSSDYGSEKFFKGEVMTHISALLAFSAVKNKDQVGLILFSDQIEHFVPPKKGQGNVQRILRDLYYHKPKSHGTKINVVLSHLRSVLKKRSVVFLISDFLDEGYDRALRSLGQKHDVIAIVVKDKNENQFPRLGIVELQDAESGEIYTLDTSSNEFQEAWRKDRAQMELKRNNLLKLAQVDRIDVGTDDSFYEPLVEYFKSRKRK